MGKGHALPELWTNAYLRKHDGKQVIEVDCSPDVNFPDVETERKVHGVDMNTETFGAFLSHLEAEEEEEEQQLEGDGDGDDGGDLKTEAQAQAEEGKQQKHHRYLQQQDGLYSEYFPQMAADFARTMPFPFLEHAQPRTLLGGLDEDIYQLTNYISGGRTNGVLHYDEGHNMVTQIAGEKRFLLFSPHESELLSPYKQPLDEQLYSYRFSELSRFQDQSSPVFDLACKAHLLYAYLQPGDLLYVPATWWHQVSSIPSETQKRNVMVATFF
jgi:hypothetical protein